MLPEITQQVVTHLVTTASGGLITAIVWLAKSLYRAKRDIDFAHQKIRCLQQQIDEIEEDLCRLS